MLFKSVINKSFVVIFSLPLIIHLNVQQACRRKRGKNTKVCVSGIKWLITVVQWNGAAEDINHWGFLLFRFIYGDVILF